MSPKPAKKLTIALAGNPNAGKTTTFNNLTGTRQKVGNWPGVTVEKKLGKAKYKDYDLTIVDLPGTYSLTPYSIEEIVARNYILEEKPDLVVDVIDSSNLERNLYLATQLRELDIPVLFVLNMVDVARTRGYKIDREKLSMLLDVPVVTTVGNKNQGTQDLLQAIVEAAETGHTPAPQRRVRYSRDVEQAIAQVRDSIEAAQEPGFDYRPRWTSVKLLEDDEVVIKKLAAHLGKKADPILEAARTQRERLTRIFDDDPQIVMTEERYGYIAGIIKEIQKSSARQRADVSRTIDLVLTNRFLGFPIFIFFIWAMFQATFTLGALPMEWIEAGVELFSLGLMKILPEGLIRDLLVNGIVAGLGSVVIFLPNILILFFFISLFEDTGYMARAAFLMDRIMHLIGLHGKSFIPMLMGFGCNVPAIMATRTLENEKDRILTILINPLMSCSARLPVYILLAGTFFAHRAGNVIFGIYLLGIVLSIAVGRLFRSTLFKGQVAPFVMELPPYRMPMAKSLVIHMWDRSKMFLKKMGGVILVGSIVIWVLSAFPRVAPNDAQYISRIEQVSAEYAQKIALADANAYEALAQERDLELGVLAAQRQAAQMENSLLGRMGHFVSPFFAPLGIDWKGGVALITGFVAKEVVVSTMGVLYAPEMAATGQEDLSLALARSPMTPLSALAMMVFVLLYVPCLATISAIRQETNSTKWTLFAVGYSITLAWIMAFLVYQGGKLLL